MYIFYDIKRGNEDNDIHQNFHKVPFVAALDLVRSRKVVLKQACNSISTVRCPY